MTGMNKHLCQKSQLRGSPLPLQKKINFENSINDYLFTSTDVSKFCFGEKKKTPAGSLNQDTQVLTRAFTKDNQNLSSASTVQSTSPNFILLRFV
jgi:hypothetical protein